MTTADLALPLLAAPRLLRTRRVLLRVLYLPLALNALVMAQGLVLQLAGQVPAGYGFAAASTSAWKALSLFGVLGLVWTAGRSVRCVQWWLLGQAVWVLTEVLSPQDPSEPTSRAAARQAFNAALFLLPWMLLAPERRELLRLRPAPDRVALGLVALAGPFLIWWASSTRGQVVPDAAGLDGAELRFDVVGLAVALLVVGLLAALRPGGTGWLLGIVAGAAALTGVAALVADSGDLTSPGRLGGTALVAGGAALAVRSRAARQAQSSS